MSFIQQYIAKGIYRYSQIENFVSVKDYMIVRSDDNKCLMLRFSNDTNYTVTSMKFTIIQLDNSGKIISKKKHQYERLAFAPDAQFVPDEGIIIDERCHDFKISFSEVCSDKYIYAVKCGEISVYYDGDKTKQSSKKTSKRTACLDVRKLKIGKPKFAVFIAVTALVIIIVANGANMIKKYYDYSEKSDSERQEDQFEVETHVAIPLPDGYENYYPIYTPGESETFVTIIDPDEYESYYNTVTTPAETDVE